MKAIYPWAEMQIGDVREVSTHRSLHAVRSAGYEWSKKHPSPDGIRPKFEVKWLGYQDQACHDVGCYRIERTA